MQQQTHHTSNECEREKKQRNSKQEKKTHKPTTIDNIKQAKRINNNSGFGNLYTDIVAIFVRCEWWCIPHQPKQQHIFKRYCCCCLLLLVCRSSLTFRECWLITIYFSFFFHFVCDDVLSARNRIVLSNDVRAICWNLIDNRRFTHTNCVSIRSERSRKNISHLCDAMKWSGTQVLSRSFARTPLICTFSISENMWK